MREFTPDAMGAGAAGRTVLLAGATGLVGRHLLAGLIADPSVASVIVLARRAPDITHPKCSVQLVQFPSVPQLRHVDEAYLALGTTIKAAGSQAAFRALDLEANAAIAHAAVKAGARRIGLVSAMGADAGSRVFYSRIKGELERQLTQLPLDALVIARPSLLEGDRAALGQPTRIGESVGSVVGKILRPLIPNNYRPIRAERVAAALLSSVPVATGRIILYSGAMQAP